MACVKCVRGVVLWFWFWFWVGAREGVGGWVGGSRQQITTIPYKRNNCIVIIVGNGGTHAAPNGGGNKWRQQPQRRGGNGGGDDDDDAFFPRQESIDQADATHPAHASTRTRRGSAIPP